MTDSNLFIIAEIGVNHDGYAERAIELARAAKSAGADAVKTQVWTTEEVYRRDDPRFDTIKALELTREQVGDIKSFCDDIGIEFFATPDDIGWAHFMKGLGVKRMKTSSQDVTNLPFLREIGRLGMPVIYSTGACTLEEMVAGYDALKEGIDDGGNYGFPTVLHCLSSYPAPLDQMNLRVLPNEIFSRWGEPLAPFGLSDHTHGVHAAMVAVGMGATVFEKHLTLDMGASGPDHAASAEPGPFAAYVRLIHEAYAALGDGLKRIMPCELEARRNGQRFLAFRRSMKAGEVIASDDLICMKLGAGLPPSRAAAFVGCTLAVDVEAYSGVSDGCIPC